MKYSKEQISVREYLVEERKANNLDIHRLQAMNAEIDNIWIQGYAWRDE